MGGPLRSKQGCWTCRLRKKKCDEGRPHCSTCESLSITCYGFGTRPDWMGNKEMEREVSDGFKEIVKRTSKRKIINQHPRQGNAIVRTLAPKSSSGAVSGSSPGPGSSRRVSCSPQVQHESPQDNTRVSDAPQDSSRFASEDGHLATMSISPNDYALLMHFLDDVFPLQYPMYKPGILEGGRGWLLALLLQSKPFYHAALAASAYHRRIVMPTGTSRSRQAATLVQQEEHFRACIHSLNQLAQNACPKSGLGATSAVMQLAFFELSRSGDNAWQVHHRAAMNIYKKAYEDKLASFGMDQKSKTILWENLPLLDCEPLIEAEVISFRFLGRTMIWLDIISSITTGKSPYLLPYHIPAIAPTSQTKLEETMGCTNWPMFQISRIAALHECKTTALQDGSFDGAEFRRVVREIAKEIKDMSDGEPAVAAGPKDPPALVTRMFLYMSSLYLHLIDHGFQQLEELAAVMLRAMELLQTRVPAQLLPTLVAPLYIMASIATEAEAPFFRHLFSSPPLLDPLFQHRARILPILEEIWRRRLTTNLTWRNSLEITHGILLI